MVGAQTRKKDYAVPIAFRLALVIGQVRTHKFEQGTHRLEREHAKMGSRYGDDGRQEERPWWEKPRSCLYLDATVR